MTWKQYESRMRRERQREEEERQREADTHRWFGIGAEECDKAVDLARNTRGLVVEYDDGQGKALVVVWDLLILAAWLERDHGRIVYRPQLGHVDNWPIDWDGAS